MFFQKTQNGTNPGPGTYAEAHTLGNSISQSLKVTNSLAFSEIADTSDIQFLLNCAMLPVPKKQDGPAQGSLGDQVTHGALNRKVE